MVRRCEMKMIEDLMKENEVLKQEVANMRESLKNLTSISEKNRVMFKTIEKQNTIEENERIMNTINGFFD